MTPHLITFKVIVTFDWVGFHSWEDAPNHRAYLRETHRHLFKFKVEIEVPHGDRALECHDVKDACLNWAKAFSAPTPLSCEDLAKGLCTHLSVIYPAIRWVRVECMEDGEVGGSCEFNYQWKDTNLDRWMTAVNKELGELREYLDELAGVERREDT